MKIPHRLYLTEDQIPKQWYNLRADMKEQPEPMINPATMKPATEEDLYPVFCKKLAHQEMDAETRYVDIPDEIMEMYKIYRPSRSAVLIIWRKRSAPRQKFTTNSRATIPRAVISSTPPLRRLTMQRTRA